MLLISQRLSKNRIYNEYPATDGILIETMSSNNTPEKGHIPLATSRLKALLVHQTDRGVVQFIRYGMVVVIAAPIDLGGYVYLKSSLHVHYILAATISFTTSLLVNYLLSIAWVWTNHTGRQRHKDAVMFGIIGVVGLLLTDLIVFVFTDYVGFNYVVSKLVAFSIVFFWNFGARRVLFHNPKWSADLVRQINLLGKMMAAKLNDT